MAPRAIGVDIEPIRAFAALAPRSIAAALTQRERDLLATVGDDGGRLLCQLWCLKEALGKARGRGLLDSRHQDLLEVAIECGSRSAMWIEWGDWWFLRIEPADGWVGAVAVRGSPSPLLVSLGAACGAWPTGDCACEPACHSCFW